MKKSYAVPLDVQAELQKQVDVFNTKTFSKKGGDGEKYYVRISGKFIYLWYGDPLDHLGAICRLTYKGDLHDMDFAIFKYSTEKYDPNECFFPGAEYVNGTIQGAMKAGYFAYIK